jgi:hypothetical protein
MSGNGLIYLLNAPLLTAYGRWVFEGPLSLEFVRELLLGEFESAVGHESTANLLTKLLGIECKTNRCAVKMKTGDTAIIFRLLTRQREGVILSEDELANCSYEFGLLRCLEAAKL